MGVGEGREEWFTDTGQLVFRAVSSCFELFRVVDILFGIGARRGHPACGVEFFCSGRLVFLKIGVSTGPLRVQVCIANADRLLYVVHPCNRRFDPLTRRRRPKPAGNGRFSFTRLHPLWDAHISSRLLAASRGFYSSIAPPIFPGNCSIAPGTLRDTSVLFSR